MPTYDYQCQKCDFEFERDQRITEDPIKTCPECKSRKAKRLLSAPNFILKGGGWYADGYGSSGGGDSKESGDSTSDSTDSSTTTATKDDSSNSSSDTSSSGDDKGKKKAGASAAKKPTKGSGKSAA
jgi:putative FmdB family regulatory protein